MRGTYGVGVLGIGERSPPPVFPQFSICPIFPSTPTRFPPPQIKKQHTHFLVDSSFFSWDTFERCVFFVFSFNTMLGEAGGGGYQPLSNIKYLLVYITCPISLITHLTWDLIHIPA